MTLKERLVGSLFLEECKRAIDLARDTRADHRLRIAADLLNSDEFKVLPRNEQTHLLAMYSEAAFAVTGYGV